MTLPSGSQVSTHSPPVAPELVLLRGTDPLFSALSSLVRQKAAVAIPIGFAVYLVGMLLLGSLLSSLYSHSGTRFLSLRDPKEFPFAAFVYLVVAPVLWAYYLWQPSAFGNTLLALRSILGTPRQSIQTLDELTQASAASAPYRYAVIAPVVITILGAAFWLANLGPSNPFLYGRERVWWALNPFYFWGVWLPLVFVNIYMITWIVIRQLRAIAILSRVFASFEIVPKPFNPDHCNGLAPVGDFALRMALLVVLFGFWVSAVIVVPIIYGQPTNLKADTVLLLLVYIILVPVVLVPPVWHAHTAMVRAKHYILATLAKTLQDMLDDSSLDHVVSHKDALVELQRRYRLLEGELREWPFRQVTYRRFGLTAIMPLLSTAVSVLLEKYVIK